MFFAQQAILSSGLTSIPSTNISKTHGRSIHAYAICAAALQHLILMGFHSGARIIKLCLSPSGQVLHCQQPAEKEAAVKLWCRLVFTPQVLYFNCCGIHISLSMCTQTTILFRKLIREHGNRLLENAVMRSVDFSFKEERHKQKK